MYTFVPYNISDKQKGIQSWHVAQKYDARYKDDFITWDFIDNHMTGIMLDGGTTNNSFDPERRGTLNVIMDQLGENDIDHSRFYEPDLNDALTAVAFLADERVWDYETYPEFYDWFVAQRMYPLVGDRVDKEISVDAERNIEFLRKAKPEFQKEEFPKEYKMWIKEILGNNKNEFLRNLLRGKKLA